MKEIIVDIDLTDGSIEMETKGFAGIECKKFTEEFEKLLGDKVSEKNTLEMSKIKPKGKNTLKQGS